MTVVSTAVKIIVIVANYTIRPWLDCLRVIVKVGNLNLEIVIDLMFVILTL